jgi:serine/threonine protein phosphatase 1
MGWLNRLVGTLPKAGGARRFAAPLAPEQPFYAIGDIHGEFHALDSLLARIEARETAYPVICVGDYVDRGEHSAHVLTWAKHLTELYPDLFVCLKGNHEDMMLRFLDAPERNGDRWLRYGGLQTLSSFGIGRSPDESHLSVREKLAEEMGQDMIDWLRALPVSWQSGNVFVCHAGADPHRPVDQQEERSLLWGHPDFHKVQRTDGIWVVHGHTIVDDAVAEGGIISVDTGAYATGCLTAASVTANGVSFLSNRDTDVNPS